MGDMTAIREYWKTHKKTEEHKRKIKESRLANSKIYICINCNKVIGKGSKYYNRKYCDKCKPIMKKRNYSKSKIGKNNPMFKTGEHAAHKKWATAVKKRDNYTCQLCGIQIINKGTKRKNIHAHHIKSQKDFPELKYVISNGITVCNICHFSIERYAENLNLKLENKRLKDELKVLRSKL